MIVFLLYLSGTQYDILVYIAVDIQGIIFSIGRKTYTAEIELDNLGELYL